MPIQNVTPEKIADFIIDFSHEHGDCVTNLKLQKLVYYVQAWYLALNNGTPLFNDDFQAWVHGPVIPSLYGKFKIYGFKDITLEPKKTVFSKKITDHIKEVLRVYGGFSAYQLETMTHKEAPWINARKGLSGDESCTNIIKKIDMTRFYSQLAKA